MTKLLSTLALVGIVGWIGPRKIWAEWSQELDSGSEDPRAVGNSGGRASQILPRYCRWAGGRRIPVGFPALCC